MDIIIQEVPLVDSLPSLREEVGSSKILEPAQATLQLLQEAAGALGSLVRVQTQLVLSQANLHLLVAPLSSKLSKLELALDLPTLSYSGPSRREVAHPSLANQVVGGHQASLRSLQEVPQEGASSRNQELLLPTRANLEVVYSRATLSLRRSLAAPHYFQIRRQQLEHQEGVYSIQQLVQVEVRRQVSSRNRCQLHRLKVVLSFRAQEPPQCSKLGSRNSHPPVHMVVRLLSPMVEQ